MAIKKKVLLFSVMLARSDCAIDIVRGLIKICIFFSY